MYQVGEPVESVSKIRDAIDYPSLMPTRMSSKRVLRCMIL